MIKEVIEILKCPVCGEGLTLTERKSEKDEVIEGTLECSNNHKWQIRDGVIDFGSQEQGNGNNWSEYYKEMSYEEMDRTILEATPKNQRVLNEKCKNFVIDKVNNSNIKTLVDVATGRGMLLTELVKRIEGDINIISTDLSFQVLMYDRVKVKKLNQKAKVTYIACDATNLPLKNNSIDMVVSFMGIINMGDKILDGIKDANRVLIDNGKLMNCGIIIEKETEKYKEFESLLKQEQIKMDLTSFTENCFKLLHEKHFKEVKLERIGESIGEKNELDGLPFEGEWFSMDIAMGVKSV